MESYSSSSLRVRAQLWVAYTVMVVVVLGSSGMRSLEGCMEEERNGLLLLKAAFNFDINSSHDFLPSWNPNRSGDNCCGWKRVVCSISSNLNNNTAIMRVTQLWLNLTRDAFIHPQKYSASLNASLLSQNWYLNTSLLLVFEELRLLDLRDNYLTDLSGTLRLKKLQSLHLGGNQLNHVPNLAELPSLKEVYLSGNPLKSLLPLQGLKLEVLDLEETGGYDPEYNISIIWEMTSLKALSLAQNYLNASFEDLCELVNLEELDVSDNAFRGRLPPCLANMTSLWGLDLKNNYLGGTIPNSLFSGLSSLEVVSLSGNSFQGSISFASSFGNNSKLEVFELIDNVHQLSIETENPLYLPPISSQMKSFHMSNCMMNRQNGAILPSFLLRQYKLTELELSHCGIQGDFPNWLLENNTQLWYFNLMSNSISGKIDLNSSSTLPNLGELDVSSNRIEGTLPFNISSIFPNLGYLNMSNNVIHGSISSFRDMVSILDLSSNNFTGELPRRLFTGRASLDILKLSYNFLSGKIPKLSGHVSALYLNNNELTGDLSSVLLSNLEILDISSNLLTGAVPHLIGDIQSLQYLVLSNNNLKGRLPPSFCQLQKLIFVDLSGNDIGPEMPSCTSISSVSYLHLQNTNLRGLFPNLLSRASSMVTLDLRGNALSGPVPSWIGTLSNLRVLVLQGNNFSGTIPHKICQLNELSILDLSANHFSEGIPSCLNNVTFGKREFSLVPLTTAGQGGGTASVGSCYYRGKLCFGSSISRVYGNLENFVAVNFMTKNRLETYKGTVLEYMSGLDLSSNNLSGSIPSEIGWLTELHALNLSNNHLTGSIPTSFSNLKEIESLDLSHNTLDGEIPPQLTELFRLSVFNVSRNNLSGRAPDWKNQFSTFDRTCYEGNPFLCGLPLESCSSSEDPLPPQSSEHSETEEYPFKDVFWWSSAGSYLMAFIVTIIILYLNNYYHTPGFLFR